MDANVVVAPGVRHAKFDLAGVRTTGVPERWLKPLRIGFWAGVARAMHARVGRRNAGATLEQPPSRLHSARQQSGCMQRIRAVPWSGVAAERSCVRLVPAYRRHRPRPGDEHVVVRPRWRSLASHHQPPNRTRSDCETCDPCTDGPYRDGM